MLQHKANTYSFHKTLKLTVWGQIPFSVMQILTEYVPVGFFLFAYVIMQISITIFLKLFNSNEMFFQRFNVTSKCKNQ